MRDSVSYRLFTAVAALLLFVATVPVQAQQFDYFNTNSEIRTIGDLDDGKIKSPVNKVYRLNFGAAQLFAGSEVYDPPSFKPYIFPLPDFSSSNEYFDVSFDDYLNQVASSYGLSLNDYLFQFQYQNEYTAETGYIPQFSEVIQVHQNDFRAGGGFLPFGDPTIPQKPQDDPNEFEPLDPIFRPLPTGDEPVTETGTSSEASLASEIVGGGALNIDNSGTVTLDGNLLVGDSASQSAASVAVVPEPATLGLLTLGTGLLLGRRRR